MMTVPEGDGSLPVMQPLASRPDSLRRRILRCFAERREFVEIDNSNYSRRCSWPFLGSMCLRGPAVPILEQLSKRRTTPASLFHAVKLKNLTSANPITAAAEAFTSGRTALCHGGVNIIAADTEREARRLATTQQMSFVDKDASKRAAAIAQNLRRLASLLLGHHPPRFCASRSVGVA
jgi:hypothetical protein